MSTRALYTFRSEDGSEEFHVYKHSDGYPTGAARWITNALAFAWPLPRYEADEFAAAFVAANKSHYINQELELLRELEAGANAERRKEIKTALERAREYGKDFNGGGVRLCNTGSFDDVAPQDIEYWYLIQPMRGSTGGVGSGTALECELLVTAHQVDYVGNTRHKEVGSRYVAVPVPMKDRGWKIKKLFVVPLKNGATLREKAELLDA